jgi:hypothetical protein
MVNVTNVAVGKIGGSVANFPFEVTSGMLSRCQSR